MADADRRRFGRFEIDLSTGELWRSGVPCRLAPQPARVLAELVARAGRTVDRRTLRRAVWGERFVDAEQGLNNAVRHIRVALDDRAEAPAYVETVPRHGYRFVASVEKAAATRRRAGRWQAIAVAAALVLAVALAYGLGREGAGSPRAPADAAGPALRLAPVTALTGAEVGRAAPERLAVLPFADLGAEPTPAPWREALTEELITGFASLAPGRLGVIAATSSRRAAPGPGEAGAGSAAAIGALLGARYLVEGSVRSGAGGRKHVTVRLVRTDDGTHLWADRYTEDAEGLLDVVDAVRVSVARVLGLPVPRRPSRSDSPIPEARRAYLEGRYLLGKHTRDGAAAAIPHFEEAVALDPAFAAGHAALGHARLRTWPEAGAERAAARSAVDRALALDPRQAEAHLVQGEMALLWHWDTEAAGISYRRALALEPGRAMLHNVYAFYLTVLGRHDEAIGSAEEALALDPVSPVVHGDVGLVFFHARRYERAHALFSKALELAPEQPFARRMLLETALQRGALDEAAEWARALGHGAPAAAGARATLTAYFADRLRLLEARPRSAAAAGLAAARAGEEATAIRWLTAAFERREPAMLTLRVDPRLDTLRAAPRFVALLERSPILLAGETRQSPSSTRRQENRSFGKSGP